MAMVEEKKSEVGEEYVYTIPLRSVKKVPRWERSRKAMAEIKKYLKRHTKADDIVLVDAYINERVWKRGAKKPPSKIRVKVTKEFVEDIMVAEAELLE